MSHPSRVRGLKALSQEVIDDADYVAPFAGAWIESHGRSQESMTSNVAPFAGAWIESPNDSVYLQAPDMSHPSRVRGLKESEDGGQRKLSGSHPSRVRGLKVSPHCPIQIWILSHPSRVRGLKEQDSKGNPTKLSRTLRGCVD